MRTQLLLGIVLPGAIQRIGHRKVENPEVGKGTSAAKTNALVERGKIPDVVAERGADLGLVIHEAQTIPTVGQIFSFHGFRFEVTGREANRLTRLRVRPLRT